jgi:hypothetical protein
MASNPHSAGISDRSIRARPENGNRPPSPCGHVHCSVWRYRHAVWVKLGAEALHYPTLRKVDHREGVAKILRYIKSASIGRDRDSRRVPAPIVGRAHTHHWAWRALPLRHEYDAVREFRGAVTPVEPVDHILIAA